MALLQEQLNLQYNIYSYNKYNIYSELFNKNRHVQATLLKITSAILHQRRIIWILKGYLQTGRRNLQVDKNDHRARNLRDLTYPALT